MTETRRLTAANTARDGTGTIEWFPRADRDRTYTSVRATALGDTAAATLRLFFKSASGAINLYEEQSTALVTVSETTKANAVIFDRVPIKVPRGARIGVATDNAENWAVDAEVA